MRTIGVIDRRIAMRMVFTDDVTDHAGRLLVGLGVVVAELPHRMQDAAMHRLQAIAHIRQCATHDDAHRVVQIGLPHLVFEIYRENFLGDFSHRFSRFRQTTIRTQPSPDMAFTRQAGGGSVDRCWC